VKQAQKQMQENRNCFYIIPETGSKFLKFCKRDDTLLASNFEPTEMECACFYLLEWRLRNTTSGQHQFQRFASLNGTSKILPTNNTEFKKTAEQQQKQACLLRCLFLLEKREKHFICISKT